MPLFSAKVEYALRAVVDLAMQPPGQACQSREIAARQDIRGPYLDQILAVLKRDGIVRSIRGAGGGYTLGRTAGQITVGEIVRAIAGGDLLVSGTSRLAAPDAPGAAYVVRHFEEGVDQRLRDVLNATSVSELVAHKLRLDDAMSIMPGF